MTFKFGFKLRNILFTFHNASISRRTFCLVYSGEALPHTSAEQGQCSSTTFEHRIDTKLLKIAIIGRPNAGKSTLINQLVNRKVCPMSCKQHTTKIAAKCIQTENLTQLIYLDTPGLVTEEEFERFHLNPSFRTAVFNSLKEANVIGVVHDVYNAYTSQHLDSVILHLLENFHTKNTFLALNKVDLLKKKRHLIYLTDKLTESKPSWKRKKETEGGSWPHFKEVFYVSAQNGDGVGDIKAYLMMQAKPGKWLFHANRITDKPLPQLIVEVLEASMLDALSHEIPRLLKISLNGLETTEDGVIYATLTVKPSKSRHHGIIIGPNGLTLKKIAVIAETNLASAIQAPVHLKISVVSN